MTKIWIEPTLVNEVIVLNYLDIDTLCLHANCSEALCTNFSPTHLTFKTLLSKVCIYLSVVLQRQSQKPKEKGRTT